MRYPSNWIVWGFLPIFWYAPYILMMTALAGPDGSIPFTELSGFDDFITFSIVGWFIYSYVDASISVIVSSVPVPTTGVHVIVLVSTPTASSLNVSVYVPDVVLES